MSAKSADRIINGLADGKRLPDMTSEMKELQARMVDEMDSILFLRIDSENSAKYRNSLAGWETAAEKFPRAIDDIEEAGKCLALGRSTACLFHLMGPVQEVLEVLSSELSIVPQNIYSDTWNKLITNVDNAIKAKQVPGQDWKPDEQFYSELLSDVKAVKNAWRNPALHFRGVYSPEQAEKVYARVQDLMNHAATRLGRPIA